MLIPVFVSSHALRNDTNVWGGDFSDRLGEYFSRRNPTFVLSELIVSLLRGRSYPHTMRLVVEINVLHSALYGTGCDVVTRKVMSVVNNHVCVLR